MKKSVYILVVSFLLLSIGVVSAQELSDQNTLLISNYFQNHVNSKINNTTSTNMTNRIPDIQVTQTGNYNTSYIVNKTSQKQNVNQQGDYNNYEFYSFYDSNPSQVNSFQLGNNNNIQIFGQNELVKNISIIQKTNNQTLIIKNY